MPPAFLSAALLLTTTVCTADPRLAPAGEAAAGDAAVVSDATMPSEAAIAAADGSVAATASSPTDATPRKLNRIDVLGSRSAALQTAGSATYLEPGDVDRFGATDVARILRQAPGVYAIDEEGFGLRPNIGIRGSGTDRSSRITLMEDGVLIAPAPYAASSAYYFPTIARIHAIEIRKGSSAIEAGPRTTGGVVNLISTPIPARTGGSAELAFGDEGDLLGHAYFGAASDRGGVLVETVQQDVDGFKRIDNSSADTGYRLHDYLVKARINSAPNAATDQALEIKLGDTRQDGEETYLGLTDADFDADPYRRYAASALDRFRSDHQQVELRHRIQLGDALDLTTVAYRNDFHRNWYKLDAVGGRGIGDVLADPAQYSEQYAWLTGSDSPDDALRLRNNRRRYDAEGIAALLGWRIDAAGAEHDVELGVRWHRDEEDRLQDDDLFAMRDGELVLTDDRAIGTQDNREGLARAVAIHLRDEIRVGQFIVTPGLRHESIDLERIDYVRATDGREQPPTRIRRSEVDVWTPGIGVAWLANDAWTLFGSLHRGFNPPGPGSGADSEESRNFEGGARYVAGALLSEFTLFDNRYDNLVGTCTASSGNSCEIGDQFDGGEATVRGAEFALGHDFNASDSTGWSVPARLALTYTDATFDTSFESDFEEWGDVEAGDELPYLPELSAHGSIGLHGDRLRADLGATFIDSVRTVAGQGPVPTDEATDSALVFDLRAGYMLLPGFEIFARIENLTDQTYVVARRPAGARPGRPRSAFAGFRYAF